MQGGFSYMIFLGLAAFFDPISFIREEIVRGLNSLGNDGQSRASTIVRLAENGCVVFRRLWELSYSLEKAAVFEILTLRHKATVIYIGSNGHLL